MAPRGASPGPDQSVPARFGRSRATRPKAARPKGGAYNCGLTQAPAAPATATFPNDVPTSHPFFRYVEALYASGIIAGCGSGYCPDDPVTRGQMAVSLTKALGLYWPWYFGSGEQLPLG